jgi:hypothetical protein
MIDIYLDFESTGINPYYHEPITGFFYIDDNNFYEYKARPLSWSLEAEDIHKISYSEAMNYPEKKRSLSQFIKLVAKQF